MKRIKVNIWKVAGYKGFDDYDGPEDNNFSFEAAFDARLTKEEVENFFFERYAKRKYRNVVLRAELVSEKIVSLDVPEENEDPESEFWETLYDSAQAFVESYVPECEICRNERNMSRNLPSVTVLIPVKGNRYSLNQISSLPCFRRVKDFIQDGRQLARCTVTFTADGKLNMQ